MDINALASRGEQLCGPLIARVCDLKLSILNPNHLRALCGAAAEAPDGPVVMAGIGAGGDVIAVYHARQRAGRTGTILVLDSFAGLSAPGPNDGASLVSGEHACGLKQVQANLAAYEVPDHRVALFEGRIEADSFSEDQRSWVKGVALIWLDLDLYEPTAACLRFMLPELQPAGFALCHDYNFRRTPGIAVALHETGLEWGDWDNLAWRQGPTDPPRAVKRIRVAREAGGIGDIVRTLAVCDGLKRKHPDAEIDYYGPPEYRDFVMHCPSVTRYVPCDRAVRRPRDVKLDEKRYPYLRRGVKYDYEVSLYCPAWRHEADMRGDVTKGRVELFCAAAGLPPQPVVYPVRPDERDLAQSWRFQIAGNKSLIGVAPFSTAPARSWPAESWIEVIKRLEADDHAVAVFDSQRRRIADWPGHLELGNSYAQLAAKIAVCDILLCVDSGPLHIAGAVGTPSLAVFGATSGELVCKPYPNARWITSEHRPDGCKSPCYAFHERGFRSQCKGGCAVANAVTPEMLLEAFRAVHIVHPVHQELPCVT